MASMLKDRSRNIMDGGYVNAPDYHNKGTGKDIGLREFNSNVLVHNWFEERTPVLDWFFLAISVSFTCHDA